MGTRELLWAGLLLGLGVVFWFWRLPEAPPAGASILAIPGEAGSREAAARDAGVPDAGVPGGAGERASEKVTVHVAGAVAAPGVYLLDASARVIDAVTAAGGPQADADLDALNLAARVRDGQRVVVPVVPPPGAARGDGALESGPALDRLNAMSLAEIEGLPGIGPVLAKRLEGAREATGGFRSWDDVLRVPGFGVGRVASLREALEGVP